MKKKSFPLVELRRPGKKASGGSTRSPKVEKPSPSPPWAPLSGGTMIASIVVLAAAMLWSYWPTLAEAVATWNREPDYSHGFLVAPIALYILWSRREQRPPLGSPALAIGFGLMGLGLVVRYVGSRWFLGSLDGWSLLPWMAGCVAALAGWRVMLWALPSIGFLWFLIPIPFRLETEFSYPLQRIATHLSCWTLQCLGLPAFSEGNVVIVNENVMEIAQACSGLRLFVGVFALAYVFIAVSKSSWWEKAILILSTVPIALVANATRIVITAILFEFVSGEAARSFSHDLAGWIMIPWAALLFAGTLWYLKLLLPPAEIAKIGDLMRRRAPAKATPAEAPLAS